jgi:hypothetical protein
MELRARTSVLCAAYRKEFMQYVRTVCLSHNNMKRIYLQAVSHRQSRSVCRWVDHVFPLASQTSVNLTERGQAYQCGTVSWLQLWPE